MRAGRSGHSSAARSVGYWYAIEDFDENEIYAYHWHPQSPGGITFPHLHVGGSDSRAHAPTGRVSVESVIRLAIELDASTLRDDWEKVLAGAEDRFRKWRTWG